MNWFEITRLVLRSLPLLVRLAGMAYDAVLDQAEVPVSQRPNEVKRKAVRRRLDSKVVIRGGSLRRVSGPLRSAAIELALEVSRRKYGCS
jgi:hypothetical protein